MGIRSHDNVGMGHEGHMTTWGVTYNCIIYHALAAIHPSQSVDVIVEKAVMSISSIACISCTFHGFLAFENASSMGFRSGE